MAYSENVTIDEGVNRQGVRTKLHFEGESLIVQKTYDAQPFLEHAAEMRAATRGERWGDMRKIATIPPAEYARFLMIKDNKDRQKAIMAWLRANPALIAFERALL
jgi:hypothetical protein